MTILVTDLPKTLQDTASKLDLDGDGALGEQDIVCAVDKIEQSKQSNKVLSRVVKQFGIISLLLVLATFGSSIAAARLSKDLVVDPTTGFAFAKGSNHATLKTQDAIVWKNENVVDATDEQLSYLKDLIMNDGALRFVVKGHVRDTNTNDVTLLVEGGTLHFSDEGLIDATGDAMKLIEILSGDEDLGDGLDEVRRRKLRCACAFNPFLGIGGP